LNELNRIKAARFIVDGLRKNANVGNCVLKEFSEEGFVEDLASARAVVANGGLSLLGEAIWLGKPLFSIPVRNQYEQILNARYVEELGYGLGAERVDGKLLELFLREAPKYAARVARHRQEGNRQLYESVDHVLARFAKQKKKREKRASAEASRD
jgi:uncharacterized protein (TIGR00661 family)